MTSLSGKVAVVTGASRGIGRSFAEALAQAGACVALLARPSPELDAAAAGIGDRASAFTCNIADPDAVRATFEAIDRRFGRLDILINNAAVVIPRRVESLSDADLQAQVSTNLLGAIHTVRAAIPGLRAGGGGDIVNVSSESVTIVFPFLGIYAATKAALETLSEGLRAELRDDGIRVSVLRSGSVGGTEIRRNWSEAVDAEFRQAISQAGQLPPRGRTSASPEAMAQALLHILTLPRELNADLLDVRPAR